MGQNSTVTPLQAFLWSVGAFSLSAFVAGAVSFARGTKELEAEGINPQTRAKILPTAMKAFAAGTGVVMATSALGWYALLQYKEIQLKEVADFKSLYDDAQRLFTEKVEEFKASQRDSS